MKFVELKELADRVAEEIDKPVCVTVEYWNFNSGSKDLTYKFYNSEMKVGSIDFKTAQDLKAHMENILNSAKDEGVTV